MAQKSPPVVVTSAENAELIKYASNTFLAAKISFANFIARVCETIPGGDVEEVARGMGFDPRIGHEYLHAGPGFGGACFPKDTRALSAFALDRSIDASLLHSVLEINDTQPELIVSAVERALGEITGKEIAVLGAAFKKDTDDVRDSRAIVLARSLFSKGARVRMTIPKRLKGQRGNSGGKRFTMKTRVNASEALTPRS